jgi:transcriptional regulator with XRE-family HTH domain
MPKHVTSAEMPSIRPYFARTLRGAREAAGLSLRELARRAGTSHATLLAYENATKVPTVATFMRVLESSGYAVDVQLSPRIRERDGLDRGEELRQVLELAEQFPARVSRRLKFPKFSRR